MTADTLVGKGRNAQVLLVDDNRGDVILTKRAFMESSIPNTIIVAETGEQAIDMLCKKGEYEELPTPDMILLDLNLPRMRGLEVLNFIKSDDSLKRIPVIVLSSSSADQDVAQSYDQHANAYLIKPAALEKYKHVVEQLEQFWFKFVVLQDEFN